MSKKYEDASKEKPKNPPGGYYVSKEFAKEMAVKLKESMLSVGIFVDFKK